MQYKVATVDEYLDAIPYDLIGELMQKMTAQDWIDMYESHWKK